MSEVRICACYHPMYYGEDARGPGWLCSACGYFEPDPHSERSLMECPECYFDAGRVGDSNTYWCHNCGWTYTPPAEGKEV